MHMPEDTLVIVRHNLIDTQVNHIRMVAEHGKAVVDMDGGLQSAVMLSLATEALGQENVTPVYTGMVVDPHRLNLARQAAYHAGVMLVEVDMSDIFDTTLQHVKSAIAKAGYSDVNQRQVANSLLPVLRAMIQNPIGDATCALMGSPTRFGLGCLDWHTDLLREIAVILNIPPEVIG